MNGSHEVKDEDEDEDKDEGKNEETIEKAQQEKRETEEKLAQADNGSMVTNEQELEQLGKEMDQMKTNTQLKKEGLAPDPEQ